jgi:3-dehydroquinate synthase
MKTVRVNLKERSYEILIGERIFSDFGRRLAKLKALPKNAVVVTQKEIADHYRTAAEDTLVRAGFNPSFFVTPAAKSSEAAKSESVFLKLVKHLSVLGGNNQSVFLLALGGGVIGDLTGFAASVYRRGVPYIQIPTTLTAQVDSAIGGKTAIDLKEGKNLLGSFFQPALVISDSALLKSLPDRVWRDGFAEVIKYGVIKDPGLLRFLESHGAEGLKANPSFLEKVIFACARIKAKIIAQDEYDKSQIRMVLNFGHTAGHAIETAAAYSRQYTHGEAVAIGMLVACEIARELGVLKDPALPERLEKTVIKFGLPVFYKGLKTEAVLKAMGHDKKAGDGMNCFVLPVAAGKTIIRRDVPLAAVVRALETRKG